MRIVAALAGMAVIHAGGIAQLTLMTGSFSSAVALGSAPFALADTAKAVVAGLLPRRMPSA
jgi:biotin transporter BioY